MDDTPEARVPPEIWIGDASGAVDMLAADLEAQVRRASSDSRRFTLALPGGSVGVRCFPRLATLPLDWARIVFFWVDERAVPPDDPESNYRLARVLWLDPAGVPAASIQRMTGEAADLGRAAAEYADVLMRVAGDPPRLDYVLLGVGPDGHVASLFPGRPALSREEPVVVVDDAPIPIPRRLSLSLPVLTSAERVVIVAFGAAKAPVILEALGDPESPLPVARVARGARRCLFLLDRAAGRLLERGA